MQFLRGFSRAYLVPTLVFIIFPLWVSSVLASTTIRTIDDTTGDSVTRERPVYLPAGGVWKDATCRGCAVQPDPSRAYGRTWTAATYSPSIDNMTIQFEFRGESSTHDNLQLDSHSYLIGIALDVYFILANSIADVETTSVTKCDFILDGVAAGSFLHTPSPNTEIQYNALVFSRTGLANEAHTFVIRTSADHDVYVNFDYAQYMYVSPITMCISLRTHTASQFRRHDRCGWTVWITTRLDIKFSYNPIHLNSRRSEILLCCETNNSVRNCIINDVGGFVCLLIVNRYW